MEKIKIDYLVPVLVNYLDKDYICFIDYLKSNVHFIENLEEDIKEELFKLIIKEVNDNTLVDIQVPDINNDTRISRVISEAGSDLIREKFNNFVKQEKDENE